VSIDILPTLQSFEHPLQESIRQLRQGYQSIQQCLDEALSECDARAAALAESKRQLAEAQRSLSERERQLAEHVKAESEAVGRANALRKHVEARQAELAQANEKLMQSQHETAQSQNRLELQVEQNQQMRAQIERLNGECEASRGDLAQLRAQFAPLMQAAAEAAQLRADLSGAQGELSRLREQLAAAPADAVSGDQLAAMQVQKQQLEGELDSVRNRAAELAVALDETKRQTGAEREQWSEELRQMRKVLERQSELLSRANTPAAPTAPTTPAAAAPAGRAPTGHHEDDTVLDSVLEQFEALQRSKIHKLTGATQ
jgi:DNA repair exonuclease SbcCD ATPase subunit